MKKTWDSYAVEREVTNQRGTFKMLVRFIAGNATAQSVQVNAWKDGFAEAEKLYRAHGVEAPENDDAKG